MSSLSFFPCGDIAVRIFGSANDNSYEEYIHNVHFIDSYDESLQKSGDIVIGMVKGSTSMNLVVLRRGGEDEEDIVIPSEDSIWGFYGIGQYLLKTGQAYTIHLVDTSHMDSEQLEDVSAATFGMLQMDDGRTFMIAIHISNDHFLECEDEETGGVIKVSHTAKLKPALEPIYFGDKGVIKDWRAAVDLWVASLDVSSNLRKCSVGKTHYERKLEDGNWKNINTYKEVCELGTLLSGGRDIYEDFKVNYSNFSTIAAQGKSAFIRFKRKAGEGPKAISNKAKRC